MHICGTHLELWMHNGRTLNFEHGFDFANLPPTSEDSPGRLSVVSRVESILLLHIWVINIFWIHYTCVFINHNTSVYFIYFKNIQKSYHFAGPCPNLAIQKYARSGHFCVFMCYTWVVNRSAVSRRPTKDSIFLFFVFTRPLRLNKNWSDIKLKYQLSIIRFIFQKSTKWRTFSIKHVNKNGKCQFYFLKFSPSCDIKNLLEIVVKLKNKKCWPKYRSTPVQPVGLRASARDSWQKSGIACVLSRTWPLTTNDAQNHAKISTKRLVSISVWKKKKKKNQHRTIPFAKHVFLQKSNWLCARYREICEKAYLSRYQQTQ